MSIESKLKELIQSQYKSIREFAIAVDMPYSTVDSIFKRGLDKASVANIIKICQYLRISVDELADGRIVHALPKPQSPAPLTPAGQRIGRAYEVAPPPVQKIVDVTLEPYLGGNGGNKKAPSRTEGANAAAELYALPDPPVLRLYTQPSAAGLGNYIDDEDYELVSFPDAPSRANIAVRISGDSMEPDYQDGDIVFVETESVLRDGEVGIFNYDGNGYLKILKTDPLRMVSRNPAYEDIHINKHGDVAFRTIGRVVGVAE